MKTRTLTFIIALMCFSLVGMIGVQGYWVRQTWQAKEAQFDRTVNDALAQVVNQLEEKETETIVKQHLQLKPEIELEEEIKLKPAAETRKRKKRPHPESLPVSKEKETGSHKLVFRVIHKQKEKSPPEGLRLLPADSVRFVKFSGPEFRNLKIDSLKFPTILNADSILKTLRYENVKVVNFNSARVADSIFRRSNTRFERSGFTFYTDTLQLPKPAYVQREKVKPKASPEQKRIIRNKQQQAEKVMQKMVVDMVRKEQPAQRRLNISEVDSLLRITLESKGISLPYTFLIADKNEKPLLLKDTSKPAFKPQENFYQASLFPNDLVRKQENLVLQFPDKQQYVLNSMSTMLGISILFTLIITGTFGTTLHFMNRQKKISDIKSDFINNMTHEFKTPIATISLATDAIKSPKIIQDQQRIGYYTGIIQQENKRMLSQVENVLQMALLDRQELRLNFELLSLNELVESAIEKLKLQVESRNGQITFLAQNPTVLVSADRFHLENALVNLLDNANKYSPENPEITVSLHQQKDQVLIQVTDQGIGMNAEEQRRIFDKFYRVSTGNLHDVKGFGLGLSYVKNIVQLHGGQVKVKSALGKGSTFQIVLPQA